MFSVENLHPCVLAAADCQYRGPHRQTGLLHEPQNEVEISQDDKTQRNANRQKDTPYLSMSDLK